MEVTYINYKEKEIPYINRDISWLDFNYRVFQEVKDPSVPLLEKIKFLAIYSNNLDEFFRVRVASNRNLLRLGKKTKKRLDFDPEEIQLKIIEIVNQQQKEFSSYFISKIIPDLKANGIELLMPEQLDKKQLEFISKYFTDFVLPHLEPMILIRKKVRPFLNNAKMYLAILLEDPNNPKSEVHHALVKIPTDVLPRFIKIPSRKGQKSLIMLDDLIRSQLQFFFPGYNIKESYSIKLSRDADLYIDDEYTGDLIQKIKTSLTKRQIGPASRFVYDRSMPRSFLKFYTNLLDITNYDLFIEGRYHNNFDFFKFPSFGLSHLKNVSLPPIPYVELEDTKDFFKKIKERDHLIHVPYQSYESVIRFFEEAAKDPLVTHIKIVQYRVAKKSRIMNALIAAAKAGKHVSVFVEVKARFDEEANLKWGEVLEKHGIQVQYSFPGIKVHSKLALVRRREGRYYKHYCYLGTGNFHENTVFVYSDFGILTYNKKLTDEVAMVFNYLETQRAPEKEFQKLVVGQFNLRKKLRAAIDFEIKEAKEGRHAAIMLKMNSLQDPEMINLLYEASQVGVKIKLIIRGICSLVPGLKGYSENIKAISIVDQFLEHARVFHFHHSGEELLYLGSADWMVRNLSHRIETLFPILDPDIKSTILELLDLQWNDNTKSRHLHAKKTNQYRKSDLIMPVRAQIETYYYYKRLFDTIA